MDIVDHKTRSRMMASVKQVNTRPEKVVRSLLHKTGYRFRLHRRDLPGSPDIVLPRYRIAIFVHGCFWHGHPGCKYARRPASNRIYWNTKLDENITRDAKKIEQLKQLGWYVVIIWECQVKDPIQLREVIRQKLPKQ